MDCSKCVLFSKRKAILCFTCFTHRKTSMISKAPNKHIKDSHEDRKTEDTIINFKPKEVLNINNPKQDMKDKNKGPFIICNSQTLLNILKRPL